MTTRAVRAAVLLATIAWLLPVAACAQVADADAKLQTGDYDDAIAIYTRAVQRDTGDVAARRGLALALFETGKYPEAAAAASLGNPSLALLRGDIAYERGLIADAERFYTEAITSHAPDSLLARARLNVLRYERGERDAALNDFDRFIDIYNSGRKLSSSELHAVGIACRYLGSRDPQLFKDALKALDQAVAADAHNIDARLDLGDLFMEKYNSADARSAFAEILKTNESHPRALLGLAKVLDFDGSPQATEMLQKSLETNPNLVDARVLAARTALMNEDYEKATKEADLALAVNAASLPALSVLAATRFLQNDLPAYEKLRARALAINPKHAEFYLLLADLGGQTRQYRGAVDAARQALAIDSTSARAWSVLGINQLRHGEMAEGRRSLNRSFAGDPYNVWTKNTLDLLDTFDRYRDTTTARFHIVIDSTESELLAPYVAALAEEAFDKLAARYKYRPDKPIRLEVISSHADFSVRTVGMAGLGALGVSFGNVLAMDSPSAREAGQFNWGSTLWHETAHAFHLGMTNHRVPRWLTEGLAVLEERRARPGWGDDVAAGFLVAFKDGRLLPVSRLNEGFTRPKYPQQVEYSYYQASLVAEMIEAEKGFDAVLDILRGYRDAQKPDVIFKRVLGTDLETFDNRFDAYLRRRFAGPLAALRSRRQMSDTATVNSADTGDFGGQLSTGVQLYRRGQKREAIGYFLRARTLFPEYAGPDSPYSYLARIYEELGDRGDAAEELKLLTAIDENNIQANEHLATLLESTGDIAGAAAALERAVYIYPIDLELHTRLAGLYQTLGNHPLAVRERRAVLALAPVDRADALYQLAAAYHAAGDRSNARSTVLRALEAAPNFAKAQDLLLQLRDEGTR